MKKVILCALMITGLVFSAFADGDTKVTEMKIPVDKCAGNDHVLNVVINDIPCKASSCQNGTNADNTKGGISALAQLISGSGGVQNVGQGVKNMLSNALKETRCFNVVDTEQIDKLKKIAAMTGQEVKLPKIDLFVDGSINAIDVTKSGGALAGGVIPIVGLFSKTKESANMAFDLSVLNPNTAEVIDTKTFQADSAKSSWGFGAAGLYNAPGLGGWSISKSLVLDTVVREVVFNIANHMAEKFASAQIISRPGTPDTTNSAQSAQAGQATQTTPADNSTAANTPAE